MPPKLQKKWPTGQRRFRNRIHSKGTSIFMKFVINMGDQVNKVEINGSDNNINQTNTQDLIREDMTQPSTSQPALGCPCSNLIEPIYAHAGSTAALHHKCMVKLYKDYKIKLSQAVSAIKLELAEKHRESCLEYRELMKKENEKEEMKRRARKVEGHIEAVENELRGYRKEHTDILTKSKDLDEEISAIRKKMQSDTDN